MLRVSCAVALALAAVGRCEDAAVSEVCTAGEPGCGVGGASMLQARTSKGKVDMKAVSKAQLKEDAKMMQVKQAYLERRQKHFVQRAAYTARSSNQDCGQCDGCLLYGNCFTTDPQGHPATADVCWNHTGTWCGSVPDGQTPPPPPPPPQWCARATDFQPHRDLGHGMCHSGEHHITKTDCDAAGCYGFEDMDAAGNLQTACLCFGKDACDTLNGNYVATTCVDMARANEADAVRQANAAGSCEGVHTSWGQPLSDWLTEMSGMCCENAPANYCNPTLELAGPCKDADDFEGDRTLHGWCDYSAPPSKQSCEDAGCYHFEMQDFSHCACSDEDNCSASGGNWHKWHCSDELKHWGEESHLLQQVHKDGASCASVSLPWGETLDQRVHMVAQQCCSSFPETACGPAQ